MNALAILAMVGLIGGCAGGKSLSQKEGCDYPERIAYIKTTLMIAQAGYNIMLRSQADPKVAEALGKVDGSLDILGQLAFDVICPTLDDVNAAEKAMYDAQAAKKKVKIIFE